MLVLYRPEDKKQKFLGTASLGAGADLHSSKWASVSIPRVIRLASKGAGQTDPFLGGGEFFQGNAGFCR